MASVCSFSSFCIIQAHTVTYSTYVRDKEYWVEQMATDMCKVNPGIMGGEKNKQRQSLWIEHESILTGMHVGATKLQRKFDLTSLAAQSSPIHPTHINRTSALIRFVVFLIWLSPPSSVLCTASVGNSNARSSKPMPWMKKWGHGETNEQHMRLCWQCSQTFIQTWTFVHLPQSLVVNEAKKILGTVQIWSQRWSVVDNNRKEDVNTKQ